MAFDCIGVLEKKRDGHPLSEGEIRDFVLGYSRDEIPDYQMSAMLMAIFLQGMNPEETAFLTEAMLESGERVRFEGLPARPVDKHSTGGVGDKITLPLVPLVMAYGVPVPMLSGRGLGHSGGTLDKLESIPGFRVDLSLEQYRERVQGVGAVIMGQTRELAPADKKIYALRDVTATVPSIPLITASILSKKAAGGAQALVLDVKTGAGAFMTTREKARQLAHSLCEVGARLGLEVSGFLTSMNAPLGRFVGNALEVRESLDILKGEGPEDTTELTVALGGEMLRLAGVARDEQSGREKMKEAISNGRGLENLKKLIISQEGNPAVVDDPSLLPQAADKVEVASEKEGFISGIDSRKIGLAAIRLGAGRRKVEDPVDPSVGVEMLVRPGEKVEIGQPVVCLYTGIDSNIEGARMLVRQAFQTAEKPPEVEPLILEKI
jgi:pyrimidine-nucleoside phosphorylase